MATLPKLTRLESEIFLHRLAAPDSLVEVLDEYHESDILAVISFLTKGDLDAAEKVNKKISDEVLADCVEGSTFFGSSLMGESDQKQNSILRAGNSLAEKIGKYIGRELDFPSY